MLNPDRDPSLPQPSCRRRCCQIALSAGDPAQHQGLGSRYPMTLLFTLLCLWIKLLLTSSYCSSLTLRLLSSSSYIHSFVYRCRIEVLRNVANSCRYIMGIDVSAAPFNIISVCRFTSTVFLWSESCLHRVRPSRGMTTQPHVWGPRPTFRESSGHPKRKLPDPKSQHTRKQPPRKRRSSPLPSSPSLKFGPLPPPKMLEWGCFFAEA